MYYSRRSFTDEECLDIRASYRGAKDPKKQIAILADLYACDTRSIENVLGNTLTESTATKQDVKAAKPSVHRNRSMHERHSWTNSEIEELISLKAKGTSNADIAKHFNVSTAAVSGQILRYKKDVEKFKSNLVVSTCDEAIDGSRAVKDSVDTSSTIKDAIALLKEFEQTFLVCDKFSDLFDAYKLGILIGTFSSKVSSMIERLNEIVK